MGLIETGIQLYIATLVVVAIHELGHFPEKIKFKFGLLPSASAMRAKYRLGGLIANVILFTSIYYSGTESMFLKYIGMIAWAHFILYSIFGSIIPEPKESQVNIDTYVFDDVPNKDAPIFITLAILAFLFMRDLYVPIIQGVLP